MVLEVDTMGSFRTHPALIMTVGIVWLSLLDAGLTCSGPGFLARVVSTVDEQVLYMFKFFNLHPFAGKPVFEVF